MERPDAETIARYEAAVPNDERAVKGQMFGHPCAFVNGNMFFGTFAQTIIARLGQDRVDELASGGVGTIFEPMAGRAWREYLQMEAAAASEADLAARAREALEYTAALPPKPAKKSAKKTSKK